jgi:hypothetical protein
MIPSESNPVASSVVVEFWVGDMHLEECRVSCVPRIGEEVILNETDGRGGTHFFRVVDISHEHLIARVQEAPRTVTRVSLRRSDPNEPHDGSRLGK